MTWLSGTDGWSHRLWLNEPHNTAQSAGPDPIGSGMRDRAAPRESKACRDVLADAAAACRMKLSTGMGKPASEYECGLANLSCLYELAVTKMSRQCFHI